MEHAVIVHLRLDDDGFGSSKKREALNDLQGQLREAIEEAFVGEFDGNEFGESECIIFMYGADADLLFDTIQPILNSSPHANGGFAVKRYGEASGPEAREISVKL
jgi:hypothetical protein